MENKGQNKHVWKSQWEKLSPISEIQMWDFFGLRNWILKYTPRNGKVVEAGCGLGRYVFYLSQMGVDIEGLDFSNETVDFLNQWKVKNGLEHTHFITGNVLNLPYKNNALAGYLSFGVIEHFIEGPHHALQACYRALRPGGVAVISTPNPSFNIRIRRLANTAKSVVKRLVFYPIKKPPFFQYWFSAKTLKRHIEKSGLYVTRADNADLLYAFLEFYNFNIKKIRPGTFSHWFSNKFENTRLRKHGGQSITIAVKVEDKMHCFLCGELKAQKSALDKFDVPICPECEGLDIVKFYKKGRKIRFDEKHLFNPPLQERIEKKCDFCHSKYHSSPIFENHGFSKNVCNKCLKDKEINILLSNMHVKPIWRTRISKGRNKV